MRTRVAFFVSVLTLIAIGVADAAAARCFQTSATIVGTQGADHIIGTSRPDVIQGLGGDDVIAGLRNNDLICGGEGDDLIRAGPGKKMCSGARSRRDQGRT